MPGQPGMLDAMLAGCDVLSLIPIRDAAQARAFYEGKLGLRFIEDDGFALVFEAGARFLRLSKVESFVPHPFSIIGWMVPDIVASARSLREAGIEPSRYAFLEQDELGVWIAPDGHAKILWFEDPDKNVLSLIESPQARP